MAIRFMLSPSTRAGTQNGGLRRSGHEETRF